MAKLTVTYRCGHEIHEVRFGGKYDQQLDDAKNHLDCPDCYRASQAHIRQDAAAQRLAQIAHVNPCPLQGSEKQIAWATDIRSHILIDVLDTMQRMTKPEDEDRKARLLTLLTTEPSAKWWIDRRDQPPLRLAAEVAKAHGLIHDRPGI